MSARWSTLLESLTCSAAYKEASKHVSGLRQGGALRLLCDAKIQDLDVLFSLHFRKQDVFRFDIPMNDTVPVGDFKRGENLNADAQRAVHGNLAERVDLFRKRNAFNVIHHKERNPCVRLPDVQCANDAWVLKRRLHLRFGENRLTWSAPSVVAVGTGASL